MNQVSHAILGALALCLGGAGIIAGFEHVNNKAELQHVQARLEFSQSELSAARAHIEGMRRDVAELERRFNHVVEDNVALRETPFMERCAERFGLEVSHVPHTANPFELSEAVADAARSSCAYWSFRAVDDGDSSLVRDWNSLCRRAGFTFVNSPGGVR